jgi:hypothetical protein
MIRYNVQYDEEAQNTPKIESPVSLVAILLTCCRGGIQAEHQMATESQLSN